MDRKRVLVSYDKLSPELLTALNHQYPRGYANHIKRLDAPNPFHYLLLELQEAVYMIKINLSQALRADDLEDEDFYDDEEFRDESMNYPDGE